MFWTLLLCHLIADYPLQTDTMVHAKKRLLGLTLHIAMHSVTMLVVVWGVLGMAWRIALPVVFAVTVLHFAIDLWKNTFSRLWPQWVIGGYLQDQGLHIASLFVVAAWLAPATMFTMPAPWIIYASGYVLVTHAWFVTERVLTYRNKARQTLVNAQLWPRMVSRALLLTLLLLGWHQIGAETFVAATLILWPYATHEAWPRFWMIDVAVAGGVMLFIFLSQSI